MRNGFTDSFDEREVASDCANATVVMKRIISSLLMKRTIIIPSRPNSRERLTCGGNLRCRPVDLLDLKAGQHDGFCIHGPRREHQGATVRLKMIRKAGHH